jgi:hypothetical protein
VPRANGRKSARVASSIARTVLRSFFEPNATTRTAAIWWYPNLVEENRFIDQPYSPEEGNHFSKDLADQALQVIRDQKADSFHRPDSRNTNRILSATASPTVWGALSRSCLK